MSLFMEIPEFPLLTQCGIGGRKLPCRKPARFVQRFDRTPTCDGQTQTDTGP